MNDDDPFASLSPDVFGSHPPAAQPKEATLDDVDAGTIRFRGRPRHASMHGCDDNGRVPAGAGFYVGSAAFDLCPVCFEPEREQPEMAPSPEDQARFARYGIGCGGTPRIVELATSSELDSLVQLLDEHDVRRILVRSSSPLPRLADARIHAATGTTLGIGESGSQRTFELQLQGLAYGPPIDPGLVAALEAAKDGQGVIRDAELADRYFEALIAQSKALDELMGRSEPVIEQGPVFTSLPEDDPLPD